MHPWVYGYIKAVEKKKFGEIQVSLMSLMRDHTRFQYSFRTGGVNHLATEARHWWSRAGSFIALVLICCASSFEISQPARRRVNKGPLPQLLETIVPDDAHHVSGLAILHFGPSFLFLSTTRHILESSPFKATEYHCLWMARLFELSTSSWTVSPWQLCLLPGCIPFARGNLYT